MLIQKNRNFKLLLDSLPSSAGASGSSVHVCSGVRATLRARRGPARFTWRVLVHARLLVYARFDFDRDLDAVGNHADAQLGSHTTDRRRRAHLRF